MKKTLLIILILALSACVYQQHGNSFDVTAVNELQPGVSTEQDAIEKLGKPMATNTYANGNQLLQWQYVYGTAVGIGGGAHAAILFDPNGTMIRVTHLSQQ
jgi:outer membrane protein assembly factor BamE (lipoprotein component of BamABCDE complex)